MATIVIPTPLRKFTNQQSKIEVSGSTLQEAISDLTLQFPDLKKNLLDENNKLRSFVNVFVQDEDIRNLQGELTPITENNTISIIPAIAGGL
ncbi:MAG: MoaD/ThiS family protein [Bacteroidia bacterium]|nr:MoaD/ThiS family protein [Bacteroidia bacterium]